MVKFVLVMVVLNVLLCYPPGTEGWGRIWGKSKHRPHQLQDSGREESPRSRIMSKY